MNAHNRGIAWAAGWLASLHGETELAYEMLTEAGMIDDDFSSLDEFDKEGLRLLEGVRDKPLKGLDQ